MTYTKDTPISSISRKLIVYIVLCSSFITLILTGFQVYSEYESDVLQIENEFEGIKNIHLESFATNLWYVDMDKLKILAEGLSRIRDVAYVAVTADGKILAEVGEDQIKNSISHTYPLIHRSERGEVSELGQLTVIVDLSHALDRAMDRAIIILISNTIKTALVVAFMLVVIDRIVIRHLKTISEYMKNIRVGQPIEALALDRRNGSAIEKDELDLVVESVNETSRRMAVAFAQVQLSETALRESEERLNLSLEAGQIGTFSWNIQDDTHFWDDRMHDIWGLEHGTYQGTMKMDFLERLHPDDADRVNEAISGALEDDTDYNIEYRIIHSDNTTHHIHAFATVYRDSQGQPVRLVGACLDVTERNQLEEQLRRSQKMDAVGQLTGGIAHDFNNILGIILGNLEIIQRLPPGDSGITGRLDVARKTVERGAQITQKLLGFSRKDSHEVRLVDINGLVNKLLDLITKSLTVSVDVRTYLADDLWTVEIDPGDFEDAILNLALNARDAMPDGGNLSIETENIILDRNFVERHPQAVTGSFVLVSIRDTGAGMTEKVKEKVFEPFFTTKEVGKGTGLGLSMVYGFIERSGGLITIDSEIGNGTAFHLFIPRTIKNEIDLNELEIATVNLPRGREKILIVDDEEGLRDIAAFNLEELGYKTLVADDGPSAMKILEQEHDIDLLFCDVVMPNDMNAYELAQKVRNSHPQLQMLLTSGYDKKLSEIENSEDTFLIKLGKSQLNKPYTTSELAIAIRKALDEEL